MLICEVCNREFKQNSSYIQHLNREIKNGDVLHELPLLKYYEDKVHEVFPHLDVLNVTYAHGRPYLQIFNNHCKHSSLLRADHILQAGRECSDHQCTSLNKSRALSGKPKTELHRQHIREAENKLEFKKEMSKKVKEVLNRPEIKKKHLEGMYKAKQKHAEGIARWQVNKKSADENYVRAYLDKESINYLYQYPIVDIKNEFIVDFYLPDNSVIIQVNTGPYHKVAESQDSYKFKVRSDYVRNKDNALEEYCKDNHITLYKISKLSEITELINILGGDL